MDNGQGQGQKWNAKDFTAEIDRATEPVRENGPLDQGAEQLQLNEQAQPRISETSQAQIGRGAIYSTGGVAERVMEKTSDLELGRTQGGHEQALNVAEIERDTAELTEAERFVGEETALQEQERLADDQEDLRDEEGQGIPFVGKIIGQNQTEIAGDVMTKVASATRGKEFRPADVVNIRRAGMHQTLGVFNRRLGDRN